ncbi:uncharacterized protein LOC132553577 [Ylistrum balloti]|uniref:uncharacterized protein LOC132553577 n=1 Tax=Ylistrum balloti TaxID=509963 RepID=UPI002905A0D7|nr:uncharacterized protein LOC132553577 [Ylistrum balloti]
MQLYIVALGILFSYIQVVEPQHGQTVKHVHMIFMNHLDVGYDGLLPKEIGFINNILNKYFNEYFPRAIKVATQLMGLGYYEKLIYTTHPWLVSLYMDCPQYLTLANIQLQCPNATMKEMFINAVKSGIITWHAGPMNMQFETLEPSIVKFGLQLSTDLDRRFNITRKHRTLSQRDVPGMSQALIPLFEEMGVEAVSVGVNTVTSPPAVPPIFRWTFKNSSVIGLWHPGGYPEVPGPFPFSPGGLSRHDCATFPDFDHALCFGFRTDNSGPPMDITEVLRFYEIARSQFPGADVQASTFEDFVASLEPIKSKLPVVTKELGDTWIQGSASDPRKVAEMRALMRVRASCLENRACSLTDDRFYNSSRFLLKLGEHTWGLDSVFDRIHWTNDEFYKMLDNGTQNFVNGVLSWQEQRAFSYIGVDALGDHPIAKNMQAELAQIPATKPSINDYDVVASMLDLHSCPNGFQFQFDKEGAMTRLYLPGSYEESWASTSHPLGKFIYQTLNQSDFDYFNQNYPYNKKFDLGIGKFNISENANPSSQQWEVSLKQLYKSKSNLCEYMLCLEMKDTVTLQQYGAPAIIFIKYDATVSRTNIPAVSVELQWFQKPPTRMPEAYYLSFEPPPKQNHHWRLHKLGQMIDPLNVIQNGSQRLHVVNKGVYYLDDRSCGMEILSRDVGLVNVLTSEDYVSTLPLPLSPITDVTGMAFNLYNNIWDVNYIFWYPYQMSDTDSKFRFTLNFHQ